jgi:hypothetical protein
MQEGYFCDNTEPAHWYEGPPKYRFGLFLGRWNKRLRTTTYRCPACGYLESYAK